VEVKAEVWMSIIHGSRGIIYFVHQFKPRFMEAALLADKEMLEAVTEINARVLSLAPVINCGTERKDIDVATVNGLPVALTALIYEDGLYIFTVNMRGENTDASFSLPGIKAGSKIEVLDENRKITAEKNLIRERFKPWEVHLYMSKL